MKTFASLTRDFVFFSRHLRDSGNEGEPAETAAGDHVSHQVDHREAYIGQTGPDGIGRGGFKAKHT